MDKKLDKIGVDYTYEDYLKQAQRIRETNSMLLETIHKDHQKVRIEFRSKLGISIDEEDNNLRKVN